MVAMLLGTLLFAAVCVFALVIAIKAQKGISESRHQSMTAYASYIQAQQDKHDLNLFGLAQQLRRRFGVSDSFGLSLHTLGIMGVAVLFLGPALQQGGPSVVGIGVPIAALFGIAVSASLAQLSSAIPTSGGIYHWSSALGGRKWGWYAGWFHMAAYIGLMTLINGACASLLDPFLAALFGYTSSLLTMLLLMAAIVFSQAVVNHWGISVLGWLQKAGIWLQVIIVISIIGGIVLLFWPGFYSPILLYTFENGRLNGNVQPWSFIGGLLLLQKLFLGMDGAAQGAEETNDPRIRVPWAIYLSSVYGFLFGFILFVTLALVLPLADHSDMAGIVTDSFLMSVLIAMGNSPFLLAAIIAALWASGNSAMTISSRAVFSMARDNALPFSRIWSRISIRSQAPKEAVWLIAALSFVCFTVVWLFNEAYFTKMMYSFMFICFHVSYAIPIGLVIKRRGEDKLLQDAPWHLGKWSMPVNIAALGWLILSGLLSFIMLDNAGLIAAGVLLLIPFILDFKYGKRHLAKLQSRLERPKDEIVRIERKFHLH